MIVITCGNETVAFIRGDGIALIRGEIPRTLNQEVPMKLINLTPHAITLRDSAGSDITIAASGTVARVATTTTLTGGTIAGLPVQTSSKGAITGLPDPQDGVAYIVSGFVLDALAGTGRSDVYAPATGPNDGAVRNEAGHIVAVTRLNGVA